MLRACAKPVEPVSKTVEQVRALCTQSTAGFKIMAFEWAFSTLLHSGFAQKINSFTQPFLGNFNLLAEYFYPLSTLPINTTNLIKE